MNRIKTRAILGLLTALVFVPLSAQERSVDESYLQGSVESAIIREQSRIENRDMKYLALQYLGEAIEKGNTGPEVLEALEYLGLEGTLNRARENGRLVNNYPDVRQEAVRYLGALGKKGNADAKNVLVKIVYLDNEPSVIQEAFRALADIGDDDSGRVSNTIAWALERFDNTTPDNALAFRAIDAFDRLSGGKLGAPAMQMLLRISENYSYRADVRSRAKAVLAKGLKG